MLPLKNTAQRVLATLCNQPVNANRHRNFIRKNCFSPFTLTLRHSV